MSIVPKAYSQENAFLQLFSITKKQNKPIEIFQEAFQKIKEKYVIELEDEQIIQGALDGMISSLDPHCSLFDPKEYKELKMFTAGEFVGLGIEVSMENGVIKVITPYEGSPAAKAGVLPNDLIIEVDSQPIQGIKLHEAVEKLRGLPNTKVDLTVFRASTGKTIHFEITRKPIFLRPVKSQVINGIIHLKISNFNGKVVEKAKQEIKEQIAAHPNFKGVILDLRSNPGGLLDQACELTDLFLDKGNIVIVKSRDPKDSNTFKASAGDIINSAPLVVLINAGTASAPEIVAGALQSNKRAIIMGEKSFGKGSVQTIFPLSNGSAMKLTTAKYYTPSGQSIQAEGVTPDIIVEESVVKPVERNNKFLRSERALKGHLLNETKINNLESKSFNVRNNKSLKIKEDFQLLRAIDLIEGMSLYNKIQKDK